MKLFKRITLIITILLLGLLLFSCGGSDSSNSVGAEDPVVNNPETDNPGTDVPGTENILSSNVNLKSITPSAGTLIPQFQVSVTDYSVMVSNTIDTITLEAATEDANASFAIYPQTPANIVVGDNSFTIVVTAEDGTKKNYLVNVIRADSSAKSISSFSFENLSVDGVIDEQNSTISLSVLYGTNLTALTPTIYHSGVSIFPASGVAQNFSANVLYTITAADGSTKQYEVIVSDYVTVTFNKNEDDAAGTMLSLKIPTGDTIYLPSLEFTRSGYTFVGWSKIARGKVEYLDSGEFVASDGNLILYARWLNNNAVSKSDLSYTKSDDEITITGYTGTGSALILPELIDGFPVVKIANDAFYNKTISSIILGNSITTIGEQAFKGCKNLVSIDIPDSVTTIEAYAFRGCLEVSSLSLGSSVTTIATCAFYNNEKLVSVNIPDSLSLLGDEVFYGCTSLKEITVNDTSANFYTQHGVLFNKNKTELLCYPPARSETSYEIPTTVHTIASCAFAQAVNLSSINIPDSVTTIGGWAFNACNGLTSVSLPSHLQTINAGIFAYSTALISVTIPASVSEIYDSAFKGCSNLSSVTINASTPPDLYSTNSFENNSSDRKFYVPAISVDTYKNTFYWSTYADKIVSQ